MLLGKVPGERYIPCLHSLCTVVPSISNFDETFGFMRNDFGMANESAVPETRNEMSILSRSCYYLGWKAGCGPVGNQ